MEANNPMRQLRGSVRFTPKPNCQTGHNNINRCGILEKDHSYIQPKIKRNQFHEKRNSFHEINLFHFTILILLFFAD